MYLSPTLGGLPSLASACRSPSSQTGPPSVMHGLLTLSEAKFVRLPLGGAAVGVVVVAAVEGWWWWSKWRL